MKKVIGLLTVLIFLLPVAFATNTAIIVSDKTNIDSEHEEPIINIIEDLGHTTFLFDPQSSINFDSHNLLIVTGSPALEQHKVFLSNLPVNQKNTITLTNAVLSQWGWMDVGQSSTQVYSGQEATYENNNIVNHFSSDTNLSTPFGKKIKLISKSKTTLTSLAHFKNDPSRGFIFIGDANLNLPNVTAQKNIAFFGVSSPDNWEDETRTTFLNIIERTLGNEKPIVELLSPINDTRVQSQDRFTFVDFEFRATDDRSNLLECQLYTNMFNSFGNPNKEFMKFGLPTTIQSGEIGSVFPGTFTQDDEIEWNIECSDGEQTAFAPHNFNFAINFIECTSNSECSDGVSCTTDTCNLETNKCEFLPDHTVCDNGLFCDGQEICDVQNDCVSGEIIDCSANNNDGVSSCTHEPDNNPFTFDFFAGFNSVCDEEQDQCTTQEVNVTHTCNINECGAECEEDNGFCDLNTCLLTCNVNATEMCDGIDNNCDGLIDEGFSDIDNDTIADCIDDDDDNDGIRNDFDNILGSFSQITTNNESNGTIVMIDNATNPQTVNGSQRVYFMHNNNTIIEFNHNFTNETPINLANITIRRNENGFGSILIRGISLTQNETKTVYVDNIDTSTDTLCIVDEPVTEIIVTDDCSNGIKIICEGNATETGGYGCTKVNNNTQYQVTGLHHSSVTEYTYTQPEQVSSSSSGGGGGGGSSRRRSNTVTQEYIPTLEDEEENIIEDKQEVSNPNKKTFDIKLPSLKDEQNEPENAIETLTKDIFDVDQKNDRKKNRGNTLSIVIGFITLSIIGAALVKRRMKKKDESS